MATANIIASFGALFKRQQIYFELPCVGRLYPGMSVVECLTILKQQCMRQMIRVPDNEKGVLSFMDRSGIYLRLFYAGAYITGLEYECLDSYLCGACTYSTGKKYCYITDYIVDDYMLRSDMPNKVMLKKSVGESSHQFPPADFILKPTKSMLTEVQSLLNSLESKTSYTLERLPTLDDYISTEAFFGTKEGLQSVIDNLTAEARLAEDVERSILVQKNTISSLRQQVREHPASGSEGNILRKALSEASTVLSDLQKQKARLGSPRYYNEKAQELASRLKSLESILPAN